MKVNIIEYLKNTIKSKPQKTAVIDGNRSITFTELDLKAKVLAIELQKVANSKNKSIAVFLPKSIESIVADIAITYSGNCYMNLDIKTPLTRISNITKRIQPVVFITCTAYLNILRGIDTKTPLINIDDVDFSLSIDEEKIFLHLSNLIDSDPLCIVNTSGSTGTPKGVVLTHRSYINYVEWAVNTFNFNGEERLGVLSPIVFDHYNYEICLMMATGATLVLLDNNKASFPVILLEDLKTYEVTYIFWVPSILVNIANMDLLSKISLPLLKMVWFAGEVFPTKQFNYWRKYLREATFVNLYGPVEATVDCTYYIVKRELKDEEPIPIGFPCRNTDILILNEHNQLAQINEEGELCVRGTSLAMGYYNNPEKTAAAFVQNPLNKAYPEIIYRTGDIVYKNEREDIVFKGRKDSLVKHMGYRIELGEIEHVFINTLKLAENACVVYNYNKKEITLFYESKEELSIAKMKKDIGQIIPKYMVPTVFHKMNVLPRNTNGKIDRLLLNKKANNE